MWPERGGWCFCFFNHCLNLDLLNRTPQKKKQLFPHCEGNLQNLTPPKHAKTRLAAGSASTENTEKLKHLTPRPSFTGRTYWTPNSPLVAPRGRPWSSRWGPTARHSGRSDDERLGGGHIPVRPVAGPSLAKRQQHAKNHSACALMWSILEKCKVHKHHKLNGPHSIVGTGRCTLPRANQLCIYIGCWSKFLYLGSVILSQKKYVSQTFAFLCFIMFYLSPKYVVFMCAMYVVWWISILFMSTASSLLANTK